MSLRYKSLFVVVLLFAVLTGALAYTSTARFEARARLRIDEELDREARALESQIEIRSEIIRSALLVSASSTELIEIIRREDLGDLKDNLEPFTKGLLTDSKADIAITALDSYIAEDKRATDLGSAGDNATFVAMVSKESHAEVLTDPVLLGSITSYFDAYVEAEDDSGIEPIHESVLTINGRVYLVVQGYLWESLQEHLAIGVGIVLKELDSEWLLSISPGNESNPVHITIHDKTNIVASTWLHSSDTELSSISDKKIFEKVIAGQTHIGRSFRSELSYESGPVFVAVKNLDVELESFRQVRKEVLIIAGILAVMGALIAYFGAYSVIRVLRKIQSAAEKVREGKFDTRVDVNRRDELGHLAKAFNDMTGGLKALGLYTHESLARNVLDNPELLRSASSRESGTIFFNDIKGFTSITESMSAEDLTSQLNEYFSALGVCLREEGGYLDKFIGDSIMAFWGKPFVKDDGFALKAVKAAIACRTALQALHEKWTKEGKPLFFQRIGLASGEVIVGNIGTETKKNFTVIGDAVNLASRIEGINKLYGTELLIDGVTARYVNKDILLREVDSVRVVGKTKPVVLFEPIALLANATEADRKLLHRYGQALDKYRAGAAEQALEIVSTVIEEWPDDGPAKWLSNRCKTVIDDAGEYEPITNAKSK